jgi:transposase
MMSGLSVAPYFPFARMKVVGQELHREEDPDAALIRLEPDARFRPRCHVCGKVGRHVHSAGHQREVRDLSLAARRVRLNITYRKVWCDGCGGVRVEEMAFCDAGRRITHRMARYVYELCKLITVEEVARHLELDPKTVRAVERHFLKEEFSTIQAEDLRILAIDEISLFKGRFGYMTVVLDYLTGRVVWMGPGRDKAALDRFFALLSDEQKGRIEAVALDMWEAYVNRIEHHCPQAKIVFDLFHLVKGFGEVIDEVRRDEYRKADARDVRRFVKGSRFLLLKNHENLLEGERVRLAELLEANGRLNAVYVLKDQLKMIYNYRLRAQAKQALEQWKMMAAEVDHPLMKRFIGRLTFFEQGILNHCDYPIGTSPLEGVNNKIKLIKRRGYGYLDPQYFAWKVMQAFPGKETTNFLG